MGQSRRIMSVIQYQFRAIDRSGTGHAGVLQCASRAAALDALEGRGLIPIDVREQDPKAPVGLRQTRVNWRSWRRRQPEVAGRSLERFTHSLAALLTAGLTVDRALQVSASLADDGPVQRLNKRLLDSVRSGHTFRDALASSGTPLPPYYLSMVEAGEVGGALPEALARITELQRRSLDMQERVRSALIYPALLAIVVITTLVMLLTFVLPRFELLFAESEAPLPVSTRFVLMVGRGVADFWWVGVGASVIVGVGLWAWVRKPEGQRRFHEWLIRSRLFLMLPLTLNAALFFRTLSTLVRNGSPLPMALRIARGALGNVALAEAATRATQAVNAGQRLSEALAATRRFPAVAVQMARVGEETGHLDDLLLSAASVLEEESHLKIERLIALLVPLLTIGMGLIVAGLIGSVLIGLLSINDLAF